MFGELLKQEGLITSIEASLFDDYMQEVAWKPDAIVYLECSPEDCLERIMKRTRKGESGIPLDYLEKLSNEYHKFIEQYEEKIPVIRIDSSKEVQDMLDSVITEINTLEFIQT